jgi:hypothetical protein
MVLSRLVRRERAKMIVHRKKVESKIYCNCIFIVLLRNDLMNEVSKYYCHQRAGLCAGVELVIRPPTTAAD